MLLMLQRLLYVQPKKRKSVFGMLFLSLIYLFLWLVFVRRCGFSVVTIQFFIGRLCLALTGAFNMLKLYRVFGLWRSSVVCFRHCVDTFEPVPEIYFRSLYDAMLYVSAHCVGYWEIFCGSECVARSAVPEEI